MKMISILMVVTILSMLKAGAGEIKEHEFNLTTSGTTLTNSETYSVPHGILDTIYVDSLSTAITGAVTVTKDAKLSTDEATILATVTTVSATATTVVPYEWHTDNTGTVQAGTNTPKPFLLFKDTITAQVIQPATNVAAKNWRVVVRWMEP